jgi:hypothetical protein
MRGISRRRRKGWGIGEKGKSKRVAMKREGGKGRRIAAIWR